MLEVFVTYQFPSDMVLGYIARSFRGAIIIPTGFVDATSVKIPNSTGEGTRRHWWQRSQRMTMSKTPKQQQCDHPRPSVPRPPQHLRWRRREGAHPRSNLCWSAASACTRKTDRPPPKPCGHSKASVQTPAPTARRGTGQGSSRIGGFRCARVREEIYTQQSCSFRERQVVSGAPKRERRKVGGFRCA